MIGYHLGMMFKQIHPFTIILLLPIVIDYFLNDDYPFW